MGIFINPYSRNLNRKIFALALLTINFACAKSENGSNQNSSSTTSSTTTFSEVQREVLFKKCLECHNNSLAFSGLNVTSYFSILQFLNPGAPDTSKLFLRQFTTTTFKLTSTENKLLYDWILNGALKN